MKVRRFSKPLPSTTRPLLRAYSAETLCSLFPTRSSADGIRAEDGPGSLVSLIPPSPRAPRSEPVKGPAASCPSPVTRRSRVPPEEETLAPCRCLNAMRSSSARHWACARRRHGYSNAIPNLADGAKHLHDASAVGLTSRTTTCSAINRVACELGRRPVGSHPTPRRRNPPGSALRRGIPNPASPDPRGHYESPTAVTSPPGTTAVTSPPGTTALTSPPGTTAVT